MGATYKYIARENAKGTNSYELGVNDFSDMTPDEFAAKHMGFSTPAKPWGSLKHLGTHEHNGEELATSVDWVTKGAVTPVKDQGQCGSCWPSPPLVPSRVPTSSHLVSLNPSPNSSLLTALASDTATLAAMVACRPALSDILRATRLSSSQSILTLLASPRRRALAL